MSLRPAHWSRVCWTARRRAIRQRAFQDQKDLLDRILDRLKTGQENLDIIAWAISYHIPLGPVLQILEALDINSRRLVHRFDSVA